MVSQTQQEVQEKYAIAGEHYDSIRMNNPQGSLLSNFDIELVKQMTRDVPRDAKVLEAGAGTGRFTFPMIEYGFSPVATDINDSLLESLKQRVAADGLSDRCEIRNENIFALSFPDNTFDFIYSLHVIPRFVCLEDQEKALAELNRVLKPGGVLLFNYSNRNSILGKLANRYVTPRGDVARALAQLKLQVIDTRGKWFLSRGVLNRIPLFVGRALAGIEKGLSHVPRHAWDVFVLAKKPK